MGRTRRVIQFLVVVFILGATGCARTRPDYALFERHKPRTVLILPPLNNTASVDAPDKFMSTVTYAVAERGYYVLPVAVTDRMLRENGVVSPAEMRQVSSKKLREIFGADALLDITIDDWGTRYLVLTSSTTVTLTYRLVDLASGQELWTATETVSDNSDSGGGGLAGALVGAISHAIVNVSSDKEIELSTRLNQSILMNNGIGLLPGARWVDKPE